LWAEQEVLLIARHSEALKRIEASRQIESIVRARTVGAAAGDQRRCAVQLRYELGGWSSG